MVLEQRIAEQAMKLGELGEQVTHDFLERFGHDQERFADLGGYIYHARVDAVLQGLGFDAEESKTRLMSSLSGGERGRVGLAAQLIAPADLLLLDEPTDHLDLDTTTWLEDWLKEADETVIVVSHDRAFLDAICTNILHMEARTSETYKGNYSQFVGPSGAGKSSFISTLLGDRAPARGAARIGGSITPAWFRQDLADLPLRLSIFDAIQELRALWNRGQVQNHLGAFGFGGEEVFREIGTLSGGERARMALARMTLSRANLLVLDEPTNHLDVENIEVLEDALDEYDGSVLLVSHDRAFLREVATRVWWFDGTRSIDFDGPFIEWEADRARCTVKAAG
ncbi:MAG: ATP-binding cassette domain-containing protein [Gemmatimonadaceae bacterium]